MSQPLMLYDTLSRQKHTLADPGRELGVYSCGPTVYARQHLGNMRPYVFADLLKRTLEWHGLRTRHVINITDVGHLSDDADQGEDKLERAAKAGCGSAREIAARYTGLFQADLARLGVRAPDVWSRASRHIPEQIAMIEQLEARGLTYRTDDGLYFDTARHPSYGKLSRKPLDQQLPQDRVVGNAGKRSGSDFALWKFSPRDQKRQMEWASPWGLGFPGWHIECSAMSSHHLAHVDIHTGGVDHIPVHHENEIAQSEAALGKVPWVGTWMHCEWLLWERPGAENGAAEKMSKSDGSALDLDDVVARGIHPHAYRLFLLGAHYRQKLSFSWRALGAAHNAFARLQRLAAEWPNDSDASGDPGGYGTRFNAALADDLNTPRALGVLWEMVRDAALAAGTRRALLAQMDALLGLGLLESAVPLADPRIDGLLRQRDAARRSRDFQTADAIRLQLSREGIVVEDVGAGSRWRRA